MTFVVPDFYPAAAELFVAGMSLIILMVTVFAGQAGRNWAYFLTQATLVAAAFITIGTLDGQVVTTFSNMYVDDLMGDLLKLLIYFSVAVALLYGRGYLAERGMDRIEYYLLALYMTLGMMVMVSAGHFLSLYIGLELFSLSLYGMVAFDRDSARSTEAAMKYFVLGALASGLLLYGMSMIYGATGSLELGGVAQSIYHQAANREVLMFGLVFVVAGLAFKLGVVPFHMWVPDVYHGAPSAMTLFIGSAPKIAAFAFVVRILGQGLEYQVAEWRDMLVILAVLSMAVGNFAAIAQSNLKRMLAYSTISHMGFMLLGILAGSHNGYVRAIFCVLVYALMSLGGFGMILLLSRAGFEADQLDDFKGLNRRSPWLAFVMLLLMFSMAGI